MKSGIYKITNLTTQRFYIGSAVNFERRKSEHLRKLRQNKHENPHLQRLYNKYGDEDFVIELIFECKREDVIEQEQVHIDNLKPQINICKTAGSSLGRKHTKKAKKRMSEFRKGKSYHSEYQIQRIKETHIGKQVTEKARYHRARIIIQLSFEGEQIAEFRSINEAVKSTGINNIAGVLRGSQQSSGGYKWKYKDEKEEDILNIQQKEAIKIENIAQGRIKGAQTRQKSVVQIDKKTNEPVNIFESVKAAELAMCGEVKGNISNCITGKQKTAYGYKWQTKTGV